MTLPFFASRTLVVGALALIITASPGGAAPSTNASSTKKEQELIRLLNSDAAPAEKALACKELTVYGTKASVPALARLLPDEQLSSWARIPLEAIPGSAPDAALRQAMGSLQGKLLVGVINSIGQRKDVKVLGALEKLRHDQDSEVVQAADAALAHIRPPL